MNKKELKEGLDSLVDNSRHHLKDNLQAIFMFGSGNNLEDFIPGLSDLDFMYILNNIDYDTLKEIKNIRNNAVSSLGLEVDIKSFSSEEFASGLEGKASFEFFTGWGLEMMRRGEQKCLYNSGNISLDYNISVERIKKDSLDRAHYYITKIRKIIATDDAVLLRGDYKSLNKKDVLKLVSSSIKNVLTFCLAFKGVVASDYDDVANHSSDIFGDIKEIDQLFKAKKNLVYDISTIIDAYNKIEKIYKRVVSE